MLPEEKARVRIDKQLNNAGWDIVARDEYIPNTTSAVKEALILYYAIDKREYRSLIKYEFSHVFARVKDSEIVEQHKRNWIEHIVSDNAMKEQISVIFEMLSELNENLRGLGIKAFLECNVDYSMFENLMLVPNHWSGGGSLVPAYQKQIDFLESLYEYTQGVKYLRHKAKIKERVGILQQMIKDEEVAVICRNLYM